MAAMQQGGEGALHGLHGGDALAEFVHVLLGDLLDVGTGAALVLPQAHQLADLGHRKTQVAAALDEAQGMHIGRAVEPVAAVGARDGAQQTQRLVMPQHLGGHTAQPGSLADVDGLAGQRR